MKKILLSLCLALGFMGCTTAQKTEFTKEALAESMLGVDGNTYNFREIIKKYQGKTVVIDVWASWCTDCVKATPKVIELQKQFPETVFLFLSYDKTPESWEKGIAKFGIEGEHYLILSKWKGGAFSESIDLDWIPRYLVLDKNGKIALYKTIEADDENLITDRKSVV
ncbi:TlpA disulfide reductase family protein [Flavobacterium sp.]|uniref:TlpA family protein disulfide reductase n=1 Tax=Flavobacterium sp. TaxID=239 RepID=UPI0026173E24|nr:TlpA disulfide reductase family protein [Flavobacterium sp.]MDD2986587.1 TlpA disulfide reductase family protein [Flavobacterium sp.]